MQKIRSARPVMLINDGRESNMRELTQAERESVSGGEVYSAPAIMTVSLMVLSPTPLVVAVGVAALMYYAWC